MRFSVFRPLASVLLSFSLLTGAVPGYADNRIAQLEFKDITVSDALKVLTEQSNLNVIASQEAAQIHVTMYLQNVAPLEVIDALAKTYNLWYKHDRQTNIIRLYTVKEYRSEQVESKQEQTEIFTLKNAKNALDLADTISNLYGRRVRLSFGQNQRELITDLYERFERFDLIDSRTRMNNSLGDSNGTTSNTNTNSNTNSTSTNTGTTGSYSRSNTGNNQNLNNQNQVTNQGIPIDEGFANFSQALKKDSSQEGLLAGQSSTMDEAITHQAPIYVSVIKRQNRVLVRTRDLEALNDIRVLHQRLNAESSMMLMEVKILLLNLGDDFNSLFDFKIKDAGSFNVTGGQTATSAIAEGLTTAASTFNPALLATVVSQNFEARLQLLEKENRVTAVATPVLMTTNQEVSRIFIGEERPIVTGYEDTNQTIDTTNSITNTIINSYPLPETEVRNLGTTLLLTPNINADRTVGINILIEQSGLSPNQATIPLPLGNELVEADVDVVQNKTFSGTVIAKDNTSIAVGGLIEEKASNSENKVPFFGDIPLLGFFFREEAQERGRQELVVIIRPHIISTPEEAADVNQRFMQQNSIHPKAEDAQNLNIYTNPSGEHKDYHLEEPFKEYPGQDDMDRFRWNR